MSATTETQAVSQKNLYQRIRAVMEDVEYLQKDKEVSTGGSGSYKALSEETVTKNVREAMIRHGLVIFPVEQDHRLDDLQRGMGKIVSLTTVNTRYKIVNVDNPAEFEYLASAGTGVDSQDKGVGKAMTYSYKYLLLRTFGIATGKDTDSVGNAELEREQAADAQKAIQKGIALLEAATTEEELKQVGVKEYLADPKYKAAATKAAARIKAEASEQASADSAASGAPDGNGEGPATETQKEEITRLLNNPVIKHGEKVKGLARLGQYTEYTADEAITKLTNEIIKRESQQEPA